MDSISSDSNSSSHNDFLSSSRSLLFITPRRRQLYYLGILIISTLISAVNGYITNEWCCRCIRKVSFTSRHHPVSQLLKNRPRKFLRSQRNIDQAGRHGTAQRVVSCISTNDADLPSDIAELNRLLEERAAASRREQEARRAGRAQPRRPQVRMPDPTPAAAEGDELWARLPAAVQQRYQPLRVLGTGSFGEVVLASDTMADGAAAGADLAAVKIVRARAGGEEPLLLREGVVLSLLPGPPHSPRCMDFGICRGACYFVLE